MAKLTRFTMPVFAGNAEQTQTSVFGTMKTSPQYTSDVAASIGTTAYNNGWADAIEISYAPYMEDMNTLQRAITYQLAYNQQQGIPEWASDTEYYKDSFVKYNSGNGARFYVSLVDNNIGNLLSDTTKWKLVLDTANSYVTTNTAQTITAAKTITTTWTIGSGAPVLRFQNTDIVKGTTPLASESAQWTVYDSESLSDTSSRLGQFFVQYGTNGTLETAIRVFQPVHGSTNYADLGIFYPASGNPYTYAPTPETSDNSSKIATTSHVKSNLSGAVSTITTSNLTSNRALISNSSGKVAVSAVSNTELGYLSGVTSNVQTQLGSKANDSNTVHKTGTETIAGPKTFTSNVTIQKVTPEVITRHTSVTKGTTPSSADGVCYFEAQDSQNNRMGLFRVRYATSGNMYTEMYAYNPASASASEVSTLTAVYPLGGSPYATAPASDVNGSILTTANKSKAARGYFKLGNGMLLQWGTETVSSSGTVTVTFPTPFSSDTSYAITKNYGSNKSSGHLDDEGSFWNRTSTGANTYNNTADTSSFQWIAIGY